MKLTDITFSVQPFDGGAHVCMTHKIPDHDTNGFACWCHPTISVLCSECQDETGKESCWKCEGSGWVHMDAFEAEMSGAPTIVIHNECAPR